MSISIRAETYADIKAIFALTVAAFGQPAMGELNDKLRDDGALLLSHVALLHGEVVGHAAYSLVTVTDDESVQRFPALGPIAVTPPLQKQGIGSALARAGVKAMKDAGYALLFLVGSPAYYPRFGYQPALPLGFTSDYVEPDGPHEHFMVALLDERAPGKVRGHVRYHPAFADAERAASGADPAQRSAT